MEASNSHDILELRELIRGFKTALSYGTMPWHLGSHACSIKAGEPTLLEPSAHKEAPSSQAISYHAPTNSEAKVITAPTMLISNAPKKNNHGTENFQENNTPTNKGTTSSQQLPKEAKTLKEPVLKAGSFTLEPPPNPIIYDLSTPEKWFQSRGITPATTSPAIFKSSPAKAAKLTPIVIIHSKNSKYMQALENLMRALEQRFMACSCITESEQVYEQILDALDSHRLRLIIIEPEITVQAPLKRSTIVIQPEVAQLHEPSQKLKLWNDISKLLRQLD